jgi:hypothetical protein
MIDRKDIWCSDRLTAPWQSSMPMPGEDFKAVYKPLEESLSEWKSAEELFESMVAHVDPELADDPATRRQLSVAKARLRNAAISTRRFASALFEPAGQELHRLADASLQIAEAQKEKLITAMVRAGVPRERIVPGDWQRCVPWTQANTEAEDLRSQAREEYEWSRRNDEYLNAMLDAVKAEGEAKAARLREIVETC